MSYILPPEWFIQDAIMLTWPHAETDWASNLNNIELVFVEISLAILARQKLVIVCHDEKLTQHVRQLLQRQLSKYMLLDMNDVFFVTAFINDCWARDHGPISVFNQQGKITALNFIFNGWGSKYACELDNKINQSLFKQLNTKSHIDVEVVLEGGGIEIDEKGHLLTTKRCLLNNNRNKGMTQAKIEALFAVNFGAKKILWLDDGALEGDDTDSHIDTLARFAPHQTIIYQACDDQSDCHYVELHKMAQALQEMRTLDGDHFNLMKLPMPDAQFNAAGDRLPATYANFLIINGAVLMPVYGVRQDKQAQTILNSAFPNHQIIAINCREIIEQFGSLHCLTMQLPQGFLASHK